MILGWGIVVIIIITVIMLLLRFFFKTAFKIISIIWFIVFLATVAFGILVYMDAKDFSENFPNNDNAFLLDYGGAISAGIVMHGSEEPEILGDVSKLAEYYENNEIEAMRAEGEYYKVMICNESCFEGVRDVEISGYNISKGVALEVLNADDSISRYVDILIENEGLSVDVKGDVVSQLAEDQGIRTDAKMKGMMFGILFFAMTQQQGPFFIINQFKAGNLMIHEETLIFKLIKVFPQKVFEEIFEKIDQKMEDLENGSS